ncbi:GNAT family N-acetyltransferase [Zooshikella harenae]|uniref:N-acetyltransferase n=1 Tax=Zooshikella harenae TaxID=2827238 RepID=A0ABS5ZGB1_9GAMM|nr:GNAT family N-acetyltransferase [Zooshikella harenae]MBU2712017.1 N-acetyltransferase [Zooshikella harenae]
MIVHIQEEDLDEVTAIYNYYIQNTVATFEEDTVSTSDILYRINNVKEAGLPWLVAKDENQTIGYAYATLWNSRSAYRNTVEISIYLKHDVISHGWGTALYTMLFELLKGLSKHTAIAVITLPNQASIALHEKFGMQKVGHFKQVGFKFNQWLDVGYWQVKL